MPVVSIRRDTDDTKWTLRDTAPTRNSGSLAASAAARTPMDLLAPAPSAPSETPDETIRRLGDIHSGKFEARDLISFPAETLDQNLGVGKA